MKPGRQIDLKPNMLYHMIQEDTKLHEGILTSSKNISPNIESLAEAMVVLGINTIKNMALEFDCG